MSAVQHAIHILTGEQSARELVDGWLCAHGIRVTYCADVCAACVQLLRRGHDLPDLVLLGTDWLAADELAILDYVRETWPGACLVVYGRGGPPRWLDPAGLTIKCYSDAALRKLTAEPPAQVVARLRTAADRAAPSARLDLLSAMRANTGPLPLPPATPRTAPPPPPAEPPADGSANPGPAAPPAAGPPHFVMPALSPARTILTAEELAALLDDPDD